MCNKDIIFSYINAEIFSLVFGFITSVSSGILILSILMLMLVLNIHPPSMYFDHMAFSAVMTVSLILVSISFVFSVLLLNGIIKKSPSYVKAYFVYGIIKCVLYAIASIILMVCLPIIGIPGLFFCIIYGLILHMIRLTYNKMISGFVFNAPPATV